jgi:hypothetical protein
MAYLTLYNLKVLETFKKIYFKFLIGIHDPRAESPKPENSILLYLLGFCVGLAAIRLFRLSLVGNLPSGNTTRL